MANLTIPEDVCLKLDVVTYFILELFFFFKKAFWNKDMRVCFSNTTALLIEVTCYMYYSYLLPTGGA